MARVTDMTTGSPVRLIVSFALPIVVGNVFQQLYNMVDTVVVGRVEGVEALAAVGAAGWLDWLVLGIAMGMAQGFSILFAQRFGAGDQAGLRRSVAMSALLCAALSVILTLLAHVFLRPALMWLNSPENTIDLTERYLRTTFSAITVVVGYNLFSGVLRALGDSRTPLRAMIVASLVNIGLDILFVAAFGWGVFGVALATVIAQCFSLAICAAAALRLPQIRFVRDDWEPRADILLRLLKLGVPVAFQNAIIAVGGLVLQAVINGFGFIFMAGVTAANRLIGILELAGNSIGSALSTFAGQNLGAGNLARIRLGVRKACQMAVVLALITGLCMFLFGRQIVSLFVSDDPDVVTQVLDIAHEYLCVMGGMLFLLYLLFMYRSALQGIGDTIIPMWSGLIELIMRIGMVFLLRELVGKWGVYFAETSAWLGAAVLLCWGYYYRMRKLERAHSGKA